MRPLFFVLTVALIMSLCNITSAQERGIAFSVAWSPDGEKIAVGSSTGIWFFDTSFNELGHVDVSTDDDEWNWPLSVEWNAASDLLAVAYPVTGADGGDIQVIAFDDLEVITRIYVNEREEWLWSQVAWHPSDNSFAAGGYWSKSFVWDALTGEVLFEFEESDDIPGGFTWNSTVALCWLNGSEIVIVTQWEIYVVDTEDSVTLRSFDSGSPMGEVECNSVYEMVRHCVDAIDISSCDWTNAHTDFRKAQREVFRRAPSQWSPLYVADASYSPDGSKLLKVGEGCLLQVTDSETGRLLADLAGGIIIEQEGFLKVFRDSLAWRPDSSRFAAVDQFGGISIWDAQSYELIWRFEGFETSYVETSSVYPEKQLTGDSLDWFNGLKKRCIEGLNSGRARIMPLTGADVSPHIK